MVDWLYGNKLKCKLSHEDEVVDFPHVSPWLNLYVLADKLQIEALTAKVAEIYKNCRKDYYPDSEEIQFIYNQTKARPRSELRVYLART